MGFAGCSLWRATVQQRWTVGETTGTKAKRNAQRLQNCGWPAGHRVRFRLELNAPGQNEPFPVKRGRMISEI
jgi:hypothetical protein